MTVSYMYDLGFQMWFKVTYKFPFIGFGSIVFYLNTSYHIQLKGEMENSKKNL